MGFHKHTFPIRLIDKAEKPIKIVEGWANEDYTIGFHKVFTKCKSWQQWATTDLYTGTCITIQKTRADCLKWIDEHQDIINDAIEQPWYLQRVFEYKQLLEKEREEIE